MALLLVALAALPPHLGIPWPLLLIFVSVWVFGATMLWAYPRFGGAGTTLWGLLSGAQSWAMHGADSAQDLAVIGGSFVAAALAALVLARSLR